MNRTKEHNALVKAIRLALGRETDLTLWPNESARVPILTELGRQFIARGQPLDQKPGRHWRWRRFGLCEGSSDIVGIMWCRAHRSGSLEFASWTGRFVALEAKTPAKSKTARGGRLTKKQELFLQLIRKRGGFAAVVQSVEQAREAIDRARKGESE